MCLIRITIPEFKLPPAIIGFKVVRNIVWSRHPPMYGPLLIAPYEHGAAGIKEGWALPDDAAPIPTEEKIAHISLLFDAAHYDGFYLPGVHAFANEKDALEIRGYFGIGAGRRVDHVAVKVLLRGPICAGLQQAFFFPGHFACVPVLVYREMTILEELA